MQEVSVGEDPHERPGTVDHGEVPDPLVPHEIRRGAERASGSIVTGSLLIASLTFIGVLPWRAFTRFVVPPVRA
jgi:hypothetical protein